MNKKREDLARKESNEFFTALILKRLKQKFPMTPLLSQLTSTLQKAGARPIIVGGAVRDFLLGETCKDIDLEIFQLSLDELEKICTSIGKVHAVGRSFGVLKVTIETNNKKETFDVALPRTENKIGTGHRGFVVESKPDMTFKEAASRRDFTINAMGWDLDKQELLDPYNGLADLINKTLRHVSDAFSEDPLRVLRGCQFASRFQFNMAEATLTKCRALKDELKSLPQERLWEEWKKLLLNSKKPSLGLELMRASQAVSLFPELEALIGCEQDAVWHPEGDVWIHSLMVTDEAVRICREEKIESDNEKILIILGALCHDFGKPSTTKFIDGHIRSRGHESRGEKPTRSFLSRIGASHEVIEQVVPLVKEHLKPFQLYGEREKISDGAIRRLALRVPIARLVLVAHADFCGRTTKEALTQNNPSKAWLLQKAALLQVKNHAPQKILQGRHLISLGIKPGKFMGDLLKEAFEAQLDGMFSTEETGILWLNERVKKASSDENKFKQVQS